MAQEIGIGIIGTGMIGTSHLKTYREIPAAKIVAVCDINRESAEKAAKEFGVGRVCTDFRELLAMKDIAAVDICLHNNLHAPAAIAAMESGKDVYCEKPLAGSWVDARDMVDRAAALGRRILMQAHRVFADSTVAAKRLIDEGQLGKIYYAKSSHYRRRGRCFVDGYGPAQFVKKETAAGGALFDMGVYSITQMLYLMGNPEVLSVSGSTYQEIDMYDHRRKESGYDVEELATGFVRLAGGITFFIEEAWAINLGGTDGNKLAGSKGGVSLDPLAFHTTVADMEIDATVKIADARGRWASVYGPKEQAMQGSQQHWIAVLQGQAELAPTAEIGVSMMLIGEGIYLSQKLGREVTVEEIKKNSKSTALKI